MSCSSFGARILGDTEPTSLLEDEDFISIFCSFERRGGEISPARKVLVKMRRNVGLF
jgi:hypothetical protein